jgi:hypothetical protein
MHSAGAAGHHARWRSCGAFLEAGAAIRTLVARLVTGTSACAPNPRQGAGSKPDPTGRLATSPRGTHAVQRPHGPSSQDRTEQGGTS